MTAIVFVMVVMVPAVLGLADGNALSGHSSVALHSTIGMGPNKRKTQELLAAASSVSRLRGGGAASANASAPTDADLDLVTCMFEIQVSHTQPGDIVVLMGGAPSIGSWNLNDAVHLETSELDFPWWSTQANLPRNSLVECKFAILRHGKLVWEDGPNRKIVVPDVPPGAFQVPALLFGDIDHVQALEPTRPGPSAPRKGWDSTLYPAARNVSSRSPSAARSPPRAPLVRDPSAPPRRPRSSPSTDGDGWKVVRHVVATPVAAPVKVVRGMASLVSRVANRWMQAVMDDAGDEDDLERILLRKTHTLETELGMMNRTLESSKNESERKGEELSLLRDTVEELRAAVVLAQNREDQDTRAILQLEETVEHLERRTAERDAAVQREREDQEREKQATQQRYEGEIAALRAQVEEGRRREEEGQREREQSRSKMEELLDAAKARESQMKTEMETRERQLKTELEAAEARYLDKIRGLEEQIKEAEGKYRDAEGLYNTVLGDLSSAYEAIEGLEQKMASLSDTDRSSLPRAPSSSPRAASLPRSLDPKENPTVAELSGKDAEATLALLSMQDRMGVMQELAGKDSAGLKQIEASVDSLLLKLWKVKVTVDSAGDTVKNLHSKARSVSPRRSVEDMKLRGTASLGRDGLDAWLPVSQCSSFDDGPSGQWLDGGNLKAGPETPARPRSSSVPVKRSRGAGLQSRVSPRDEIERLGAGQGLGQSRA